MKTRTAQINIQSKLIFFEFSSGLASANIPGMSRFREIMKSSEYIRSLLKFCRMLILKVQSPSFLGSENKDSGSSRT